MARVPWTPNGYPFFSRTTSFHLDLLGGPPFPQHEERTAAGVTVVDFSLSIKGLLSVRFCSFTGEQGLRRAFFFRLWRRLAGPVPPLGWQFFLRTFLDHRFWRKPFRGSGGFFLAFAREAGVFFLFSSSFFLGSIGLYRTGAGTGYPPPCIAWLF